MDQAETEILPAAVQTAMRQMQILVLWDDVWPDAETRIKDSLSPAQVIFTKNVLDFLTAFVKKMPDAILLDAGIPMGDDAEKIAHLKEAFPFIENSEITGYDLAQELINRDFKPKNIFMDSGALDTTRIPLGTHSKPWMRESCNSFITEIQGIAAEKALMAPDKTLPPKRPRPPHRPGPGGR